MPLLILIPLFLITAILYSAVGFGGGSTYTALLVLVETDYRLVPILSLACNIMVVAGSCWRYARADLLPVRRLLPALVVSVPMAWIGGRVVLSEEIFILILGLALLASALAMIVRPGFREDQARTPRTWVLFPTGAATGLLAGMVGIGGGIFLAPVLYFLAWGKPREIAAASSLFILLNSVAGLAGQVSRLDGIAVPWSYALLIPVVALGGFIGNRLGITILSPDRIRQGTAVLILFVAGRLLWRSFAA